MNLEILLLLIFVPIIVSILIKKYYYKKKPIILPKNEDILYVIGVISNPMQYKSRVDLYNQFKKFVEKNPIAKLITVELAYYDRPFQVTSKDNPNHVQLRTNDILWHKENLINIGMKSLPKDWKYVAWIDTDIDFDRIDWAENTIATLKRYPILQMWSSASDLGPNNEVLSKHISLGFCVNNNITTGPVWKYGQIYGHPGYAWAATREFIDSMNGILDVSIIGSGDHHMAWGILGKAISTFPNNVHSNYYEIITNWGEKASKITNKQIGVINTQINHYWHGKKENRKYIERWHLIDNKQYDPKIDIQKNSQGLIEFTGVGKRLQPRFLEYFTGRKEDDPTN